MFSPGKTFQYAPISPGVLIYLVGGIFPCCLYLVVSVVCLLMLLVSSCMSCLFGFCLYLIVPVICLDFVVIDVFCIY